MDGQAATCSRFPDRQQEGINLAMRRNRAVQVPAGAMRLRKAGLPPAAPAASHLPQQAGLEPNDRGLSSLT